MLQTSVWHSTYLPYHTIPCHTSPSQAHALSLSLFLFACSSNVWSVRSAARCCCCRLSILSIWFYSGIVFHSFNSFPLFILATFLCWTIIDRNGSRVNFPIFPFSICQKRITEIPFLTAMTDERSVDRPTDAVYFDNLRSVRFLFACCGFISFIFSSIFLHCNAEGSSLGLDSIILASLTLALFDILFSLFACPLTYPFLSACGYSNWFW